MEVSFQVSTMGELSPPFTIEIQFDDTIDRIKKKIQERTAIPVHKQTLIFKEKLLTLVKPSIFSPPSNLNLNRLPRVLVVVTYVHDDRSKPFPTYYKAPILMKMPVSNHWYCVEIFIGQTIEKLKEVIRQLEGIPVYRTKIYYLEPFELENRKKLYQCQIYGFVEVKVSCRRPTNCLPLPPYFKGDLLPLPPNNNKAQPKGKIKDKAVTSAPKPIPGECESSFSMAAMAMAGEEEQPDGSLEMLTVYLVPYPEAEKVPLEVAATQKVGVLRDECVRLNLEEQICLPETDFMFYCEGRALDEDETFLWQSLEDGSIIDIQEVVADSGAVLGVSDQVVDDSGMGEED